MYFFEGDNSSEQLLFQNFLGTGTFEKRRSSENLVLRNQLQCIYT